MEKIYRVQMNAKGMPNFSTAQEVVRCKNCVAYIDGACDCDSIYAHMSGDLIGVDFEPYEDFYCGYGERKESE